MNKFFRAITACLIAATALSACKKSTSSSQTPAPVIPTQDSFHARIDGMPFSSISYSFMIFLPPYDLNISANDTGGRGIFLNIAGKQGAAHYNLAPGASTIGSAGYSEGGINFNTGSGSLDVTLDNALYATGTFSFTASLNGSAHTITEGYFFMHK